MSKLGELLKAKTKPTMQQKHVQDADKNQLRKLNLKAANADSSRERRLAKEAAFELMLLLDPEAVLYEGTMYNGQVYRRTVQEALDLYKSGM
jgi:heme oxygenase